MVLGSEPGLFEKLGPGHGLAWRGGAWMPWQSNAEAVAGWAANAGRVTIPWLPSPWPSQEKVTRLPQTLERSSPQIAQSGIDTTSQRSRFDVGAPRSGGIGLFRASTMRPRKGAVTPLAKTAVD